MSDHHIHPSPAVRVIVAREVAAERERIAQAIEAGCPGDPMGHKMRPCGPCRNAARIAREPKP